MVCHVLADIFLKKQMYRTAITWDETKIKKKKKTKHIPVRFWRDSEVRVVEI